MTTDGRGKHPNSQSNLRPVKKGEVRNPKGRGNTKSISAVLKEALNQNGELKVAGYRLGENGEKTTEWVEVVVEIPKKEAIAIKLINKAFKMDDMKALQILMDRTEGKAVQPIILGSSITDDPEMFNKVMDHVKKSVSTSVPEVDVQPGKEKNGLRIETED
jgi:hypothetical protein